MGDTKFRMTGGRGRTRKGPYQSDELRRRQEVGEERNAAWRSLSTADQITILKQRPGVCKRQLGKLNGV